jgi:hypothetical protein
MARDTDVGSSVITRSRRGPIAGGRARDSWCDEPAQRRLQDVRNDPRVVGAPRVANLPKEESP